MVDALNNTIKTVPFDDQKLGTSGLRKKVKHFKKKHYLENFIQSIFNCLPLEKNITLILGGDGRYYNQEAIQIILCMAAANGISKMVVGQYGLLSTPAVSNLIRKLSAEGGILLTASHNPGGKEGDFGVKYNIANGGPAPELLTDKIYVNTTTISEYYSIEKQEKNIDLSVLGRTTLAGMEIEIIDSVVAYADMLEALFDFECIKRYTKQSNFSLCFDAMHAVTGPYAEEIFINRLGMPASFLLNTKPKINFGGGYPDPNLIYAKELVERMYDPDNAPSFGAASDGDGDRHMIMGDYFFVNPSDSLAILTANAHLIKAYGNEEVSRVVGVARSMPTSRAVDRVAKELGIQCYETPTGWKFFGNLLDKGKITFCGEESFGAGADHIREKDGLWAVLFWLNLIVVKNDSVENIVREHWAHFGRNYYSRHDYEGLTIKEGEKIIETLKSRLSLLVGNVYGDYRISQAVNFVYNDPIDYSISENQGICIEFEDESRIIFRLSGTGTSGATLRVYLERYEADHNKHDQEIQKTLSGLIKIAKSIARIKELTGREEPSVIV